VQQLEKSTYNINEQAYGQTFTAQREDWQYSGTKEAMTWIIEILDLQGMIFLLGSLNQ
jgi:hypothetical protein